MDNRIYKEIEELIKEYQQQIYRQKLALIFGEAYLLTLHKKPSLIQRIKNRIGGKQGEYKERM